jgi:C-terminal processing protease CtpA/Prc
MRALAVALLLSVPLTAGDKSSLEKAVELFRSPDAGKREAGSQLAEREVRRLLAPLLKALKEDDPEVRRRARWVLLSLMPDGTPESRETRDAAIQRRAAWALHRQQQAAAGRADLIRKANQLLAVFGIRRGASHMTGFRVLRVQRDTQAARLGLRMGDSVFRLNGQAVATVHDVLAARGDKPDGSRITVTVFRDGQFVRLSNK